MGNFFDLTVGAMSKPNQQVLRQLKQQNLQTLNNCFLDLNQYNSELLTFEEVDEVIGSIIDEQLEDFFIILEQNRNINGQISIYQMVSLLVICSNEEYNTKIEFLYKMFDFNQDGLIQFNEFILTVQSTLIAICKITEAQSPTYDQIEEYCKSILQEIDQDFNETIDLKEFNDFILSQENFTKFLQMKLGIISYEIIMSRYISMYSKYKRVYKNVDKQVFENYIDKDDILNELEKQLDSDGIPENIKKTLMDSLELGSQIHNKKINDNQMDKEVYQAVIQAFCAFIVADINKSYTITEYELKYLIYCQEEGLKPNIQRVQYEFSNMNQDSNDQISIQEYLRYTAYHELSIGTQMKHNLKVIFNKYDKDQSGFLDKGEMNLLLKEQFQNYLQKIDMELNDENMEYYKVLISTMERKLNSEFGDEYHKKQYKVSYFMLKEALAQAFIEMQSIHKFMRSVNKTRKDVVRQSQLANIIKLNDDQ